MKNSEAIIYKNKYTPAKAIMVLFMFLPGVIIVLLSPFLSQYARMTPARATIVIAFLGLIMVIFGAIVGFGRCIKKINPEKRVISEEGNFLAFHRYKEYPFDSFTAIVIKRIIPKSHYAQQTSPYSISLSGVKSKFHLIEVSGYETAVQEAEKLSSLTGIPVKNQDPIIKMSH